MHQQNPPIHSSAAAGADHHHLSTSATLGVGVSIFPLLAAAPSSAVDVGNDQQGSNFLRIRDDPSFAKDIVGIGAGEGGSLKVCRDCGNRAKKECGFRRCRTCCKSRGYDCATHVKSTWVPAARRRERQVAITSGNGGGSSGSSSGGPKKRRIEIGSSQNAHTNASSTSNCATPRSFDAIPRNFRQDVSFKQSLPRQVRAPAIFRCIRVTAISDDSAEVAYQATVSISGHVFKGYLYDQGSRGKNSVSCTSQIRFEHGNDNVNPADAFAGSSCRRLIEGED